MSGLFLRMENENAEALGDLDADGVAAVTAEATEAADEVASASGDVTEVDTAVGNALEAQSELSDIESSLEEAAAEDGMSPREAEHVEARLERVASLLGTTVSEMGLSMRREHFGSTSSRIAATKMRLEGIKEWGKKIWEALVKGWNWLRSAISNFFGKITKNADTLYDRLKALQNRIVESSGKKGKPKKSELSTAVSTFNKEGKCSVEIVSEFIRGVAQYTHVTYQAADVMEKVSDDVGDLFNKIETVFQSYKGPRLTKVPKSIEKKSVKNGLGPLLPNAMGIVAVNYEVSIGGQKVDGYRVEVVKAFDKSPENMKAMTIDQLSKMAGEAIEACKTLKEFKKIEGVITAHISAAEDFCKKSAKSVENSVDNVDESKREALRDEIQAKLLAQQYVHSLTKTFASKLPDAAFTVLVKAADLMDSHLSNLENKETKK